MKKIIIKNIGQLLSIGSSNKPKTGKELSDLKIIKNAFIEIENGIIKKIGKENPKISKNARIIDAKNQVIMPGLIDCHTHLVFAGSRENEFIEKLKGTTYLEILKKGGGILSTVKAVRKASEKELTENALKHLKEFLEMGITTIEAKSGYGLDLKNELKILKISQNLNKLQKIEVIPTFLGAHTIPPEFKGKANEYLEYLIKNVLPKAKKYAKFCDIFCEKDVFDPIQSLNYLKTAKKPIY